MEQWPGVRLMLSNERLDLHQKNFRAMLYWGILLKFIDRFKFWLK